MRIAETVVCSAMALFAPLKMKQVRRVLPRVSPHWVSRSPYPFLLPYLRSPPSLQHTNTFPILLCK